MSKSLIDHRNLVEAAARGDPAALRYCRHFIINLALDERLPDAVVVELSEVATRAWEQQNRDETERN